MNGDQLTLALLEDERIGAVERKLVACLLSRWLSGLTDERLSSLHMLVRALRLWGLTAVYVDGELAPVRCQGITSWPVPSPQSAMVRVGLTRTDIDEQWREAEQRHGVRALGTLPRATPIRGGRTDVARPAPTLLHMRQVWRWWLTMRPGATEPA